MARMLFVNLAVEDLDRSLDFFTKLGFAFDERFTDETATCMVVGSDAFVMLLTRPKFGEFARRDVADPRSGTQVIVAFSAQSREEVDELAERALQNGGSPAADPIEMGDFMYARSFYDPDGHHWELVWMDPAALESPPQQ
jgi:uncharacterized protein